ncbi:MAG: PHP domain-containing protein [Termitinemataceae bacterium]|nr:MAG: PHP domain-containing protein [Termitinemataceae bacterium]
MKLDFHTHSTASDGLLSPSELIAAAKEAGIEKLALTDHDTMEGLDEAASAARAAGINFIRGVELQIDWPDTGAMEKRDFHLLGLYLEKPSPKLKRVLHELQRQRETRNKKIIAKMNELGIAATLDEIRPLARGAYTAYIGRPHFAGFLINKKIVRTTEEAFNKYLSKGKQLYEPKGGIKLHRAISAIKESGGLAILAHPASLYISWGRLPEVLTHLKKAGLDGIEAWHPISTKHEAKRFCALAAEFDFCISAGSDFHGDRRDRKLGRCCDGIEITDKLISGMR